LQIFRTSPNLTVEQILISAIILDDYSPDHQGTLRSTKKPRQDLSPNESLAAVPVPVNNLIPPKQQFYGFNVIEKHFLQNEFGLVLRYFLLSLGLMMLQFPPVLLTNLILWKKRKMMVKRKRRNPQVLQRQNLT